MKNRTLRILLPAVAIVALLVGAVAHFSSGASAGQVRAANSGASGLTKLQQKLISGFVASELSGQSASASKKSALAYFPDHADDQCALNLGSNIKVNQNCLNLSDPDLQGRGQANNETAIAVNPNNPNDLVAGNNDYRRGDSNCYGAYTLNNASNWNDTTIPMSFTRAMPTYSSTSARQYWEAGGDTSVAWDTKAAAEQLNPGPSITPLLDKPYMTVDNHVGSPFQDRIYVTWTLFAANGTANIYEAHSNNYGQTFSSPVLVSTTSTLCPNSVIATNNCDANQFSDPFTGPDGNLYVTYSNFNNKEPASDNNQYQILLSKSTDGGVSFSPPVLVAPFNDLPDCATYQGQDAGVSCVPEKGSNKNSVFRATNYASGQVNPKNANQVVVTFGSYINKYSNPSNGCVPTGFSSFGNPTYTGVKTPGACNNKILESVSNNGGTTFTGSTAPDPTTLTVVSSAPGQRNTDQWWQWSAFTKAGKLAVSYYDRQYGNDETTGNMDFSLSGSINDPMNFAAVLRVTSSSMPLPTQFPDAQGNSLFFGDYTGLDVANNTAYPIWMDTRAKDLVLCPGTGAPGVPPRVCSFTEPNGLKANDQEIFMAKVSIP